MHFSTFNFFPMKSSLAHSVSIRSASFLLLGVMIFLFPYRAEAYPTMMQLIPQNITYPKLNDALDFQGMNAVREYQFDFSYLAKDMKVQDVDVRIHLTHTYLQDVHIFLVSPSGVELPFFEVQGCLSPFPINTIFDDEAPASGSCFDLESLPRVQPIIFPGIPGVYLSVFDGLQASGIWTLRIEDHSPGVDGGNIIEVGVEILVDMPVMDGVILSEKVPGINTIADKLNETIFDIRSANRAAGFILFQNEPNPFHGTTMIKYSLPAHQTITFSVFDAMGKMIIGKQIDSAKGDNEFILHAEDIPSTGVFYFRLDAIGFSATRKMLKLE